ncbi:MAG: SPOR domain-containing protein [Candidatus Acidoferrales bacterium]
MAKGKKGSHYEMVLEDRHLLGVFFAVVLLCALFFALGFRLGENQAHSQAAVSSPPRPAPVEQQAPAPEDLSFYDRVESKEPPQPASEPSQPIYLQVAAFLQEEEAGRLADELRQMGFPPVVQPPQEDRYYRVQVGPFENTELAEAALRRLQAQGFREIIVKR